MSGQPSPSASKNAQPEPIVSGSHFFPALPLLCVNLMPAAAVTSVKRIAGGRVRGRAASDGARLRVSASAGCFIGAPSERHAVVLVDRLPLVVVLGAEHARLAR